MNWREETASLIIRHMKDVYGYEMTTDEIDEMPLYEKVWSHWMALAYYKESNYYMRIEDVPEGVDSYHLVEGNEINNYRLYKGKYFLANSWTIEGCKKVYGTG